jgi:FkbM family methyltransferase
MDIRYIAIEPSPADFRALEANVTSGQLHLAAASDAEGESDFFVNSTDGDSSLLLPSTGSVETIRVQTVRLDALLQGEHRIRLLKVEAEGFEPEVLVGSEGILSKVEFIAVDGGPERGPNEDTTIEFAINFLTNHGFTIMKLDVVSGMGRALFKNSLENSNN